MALLTCRMINSVLYLLPQLCLFSSFETNLLNYFVLENVGSIILNLSGLFVC